MSARQGLGPVSQIMFGSSGVTVSAVRLGTRLLWSSTIINDNADREDSIGLGVDWTDLGPSTTPTIASVFSEYFRMNIEDDPASGLAVQTDEQVYNQPTPNDDGYLETSAAAYGSDPMSSGLTLYTTAWRRANTALTAGVGIQIRPTGTALIVSRIAGVDTERTENGSCFYAPGDILRLTQTGNLHELTASGPFGGYTYWDDVGGTAAKGSSYRRMALSMQGGRAESSPGAGSFIRQYSASLDYIEMS